MDVIREFIQSLTPSEMAGIMGTLSIFLSMIMSSIFFKIKMRKQERKDVQHRLRKVEKRNDEQDVEIKILKGGSYEKNSRSGFNR